jgi:hypothetical protein
VFCVSESLGLPLDKRRCVILNTDYWRLTKCRQSAQIRRGKHGDSPYFISMSGHHHHQRVSARVWPRHYRLAPCCPSAAAISGRTASFVLHAHCSCPAQHWCGSPPDAEQCFLPVEIIEEGPAQRPYVTELSILEIDLVGGHLFVQTATSSDW